MSKTVVLITGVAGGWGARLATRLADEPGLHVIGLDTEPPYRPIPGLDFVQADTRNPALPKLLASEGVQVVCHLKFAPAARPSAAAADLNVNGARNVLDACVEAGVGKIVLKSSTMVYGAHPDNPAFLVETHARRGDRRHGTVRDLLEMEACCDDLRRRSPETALTLLRLALIVGPRVNTALTRFLGDPLAGVPLGFDPLMQVLHPDDAVEALAHAVLTDVSGTFNIAAEGVLPLLRLLALARKRYLPIPPRLADRLARRFSRHFPIPPDYLRYAWVADLTQMRETLGFAPHFSAEETLRHFVAPHSGSPEALSFDQRRLESTLARRRQVRGEAHD